MAFGEYADWVLRALGAEPGQHVALVAGFELVAMGRTPIHGPALIAKYQAGVQRRSGCIPCNQCVAEMARQGGVCCARVPAQLAQRAKYLESTGAQTTR